MAYWIYGSNYEVRCSNCHKKFIQMKASKYCPNCGEIMSNAFGFTFPPNNKPVKKKMDGYSRW